MRNTRPTCYFVKVEFLFPEAPDAEKTSSYLQVSRLFVCLPVVTKYLAGANTGRITTGYIFPFLLHHQI